MTQPVSVLRIDGSARLEGSFSRRVLDEVVAELKKQQPDLSLACRDLAPDAATSEIDLVNQDWLAANYTPEEERSQAQKDILAPSDALVRELQDADLLLIGVPVYNFGIPAAMKAWVDKICRTRLTFRYTESGPEGLLKGKKALLVVASGGVPVDSPADFATPYMRQALRFVGITDVTLLAVGQTNIRGEDAYTEALAEVAEAVESLLRPEEQSEAA